MIYAPQGAGKTRNAEALRVMFGCSHVVDDWDGRSPVAPGALVLSSMPAPFHQVVREAA